MSDNQTYWRETAGGETFPTFRQPYEGAPGEGPLCELRGTDEGPCAGTEFMTGALGDTWIVLCEKHLDKGAVQITEAEAYALYAKREG